MELCNFECCGQTEYTADDIVCLGGSYVLQPGMYASEGGPTYCHHSVWLVFERIAANTILDGSIILRSQIH